MTLSTYLYVQGEVDLDELWVKCQEINGSVGAIEEVSEYPGSKGIQWRSNAPGQGFPAWLLMKHATDGAKVLAAGCDEYCEADCDYSHTPEFWAEINWDTAYSYSDDRGGCGSLHARYILEIGEWLDARGVAWSWRNEFTGEVHEHYSGLEGLADGEREASTWFADVALPAIAAHMAREAVRPA